MHEQTGAVMIMKAGGRGSHDVETLEDRVPQAGGRSPEKRRLRRSSSHTSRRYATSSSPSARHGSVRSQQPRIIFDLY